jgi:hypothetical protein
VEEPSSGEPADTGLETAVAETAPPPSSKKSRSKASSSPAASGTGVLTLVTEPYAKVYLGKRYLGDTPLYKISIPAGKHALRLVDGEGRNLKLPVEIKQGETTAVKRKLDELTAQ